MSVCPSMRLPIRIEQPSPHWTDFHETWYFENLVKIQVSLQYDKSDGYFTYKPVSNSWYVAEFLLEWEMLHTKALEKNTILCSVTFFPPKIVPFER